MRVLVTGADGVVGRGIAARLVHAGHQVVGCAPRRPISWSASHDFVITDGADFAAVRRAVDGADVVAHCAGADWVVTVNLLAAMADAGTPRIVYLSSVDVYRRVPGAGAAVAEQDLVLGGSDWARSEAAIVESGCQWVALRCPPVMGRDVDDSLLRRFTAPLVFDDGSPQPWPVVHPEDVQRLLVRAVTDPGAPGGPVNVAAAGAVTTGEVAAAVGRRTVRAPWRRANPGPVLVDTTRLREQWMFDPSWSASECVEDFALATRGRVAVGSHIVSLPWRLPRVRDVPAVDMPSEDGVTPVHAGTDCAVGEFDTPIDPRFPAYVATNLSEALPGPFSPSSASVTVRGTRAAGMVIAEHLRPGGAVQQEMAVRTTGVFGHRLYAGVTSAHFMAETVPLVNPDLVVKGFFGSITEGLQIVGDPRPPSARGGLARLLRSALTFGGNLIGLSAASFRETDDFVADIDRLESMARGPARLDDRRLGTLIPLTRDHVVQGWVLASASLVVCAAYGVLLRVLCGRDIPLSAGPAVVSAHSLNAVHRLTDAARADAAARAVLTGPDPSVRRLAEAAPGFHAALVRELGLIGHRGPGEVEMRSLSYSDDPELLVRMVAKTLDAVSMSVPVPPDVPVWVKPIMIAVAAQLRQREVRRDRMVRAIWLLRALLREWGYREVQAGRLDDVDDAFYLLVDELDALPPDIAKVVAARREQQRALADIVPPQAFSGQWAPVTATGVQLAEGESLYGLGVCGGLARGRVRIVEQQTIDELQPGEVLVAKVTDIGYTPAFAFAAAVVTELGGPISHTAIVAREYGLPCVVNARAATARLTEGALVEVDGVGGTVRVLDP